jgi:putative hydrolase of the HAD superfamily
MAIRYVLFDAVGTLIYPQPSVAAAYQQAAAACGIELSQNEIRARFAAAYSRVFSGSVEMATDEERERRRWRVVVADVFHEWPQHVDNLLAELWQHFSQAQHWPLFDDVATTWTTLMARGYELGIASNFDARLRKILAGHSLLAACRHMFVSTELGFAKPDQRFFREIEQRLDARPDELLIVGDDIENDVVAPRRRGWQTIALVRNSPSADGIRSLSELCDCLP